ncbi:MAG: ComEC/Rec2 family competence protein [Acetobacteraceae bacterium]|nr:ComEC/Rec2 family competence protein [Acetobacteraceae bacterium]
MQLPARLSPLARLSALADAERGRFAPFLAIALAAGAALYYVLAAEPGWRTGPAMATGGMTLVLLGRRHRGVLALGLLVAACGIGFSAAQWATGRAPPQPGLPTRATIVTGSVAMVEPLPKGRRVTLAAPRLGDAAPLSRTLRIRLRADDPVVAVPGDTLRVRAMLMAPSGAPLPGGWDIQFDAYHTGGGGFGYALNPAERLASAPPTGLKPRMRALQEAMMARIHAALPGPIGRLAAGLMVGGAGAIAPEDQAAFRGAGLSHLLAISGLHLGIAMGLVFAAVRLVLAACQWTALRLPTKAIAAVCALAAGGFYTLLTGAQVPMLRCFAAACLVTLAILAGRRAISLRAWALALVAVLLAAPYEVVRVSFQMSFAATLALIAGFEALRPWLTGIAVQGSRPRRALAWLAALVLTSALAGTASAPYGAYHFGAVQLYYVIANMAAVPLTSVLVMPSAVLAMLLMPLHLEWLALVPMGWGVEGLRTIARTVSAWPQAVVPVPHIAPWGLAAYSLGLAWLALWRTRLRLLGVLPIAAGLLSAPLYRAPDLLVSSDARLIALRAGSVLYVERTGSASGFVLESWLQHLGLRDWRAMPPAGAASPDGAVACAARACTLRPRANGPAALLLRGPPDADACTADLAVSAEPLRLDCPGMPAIDRFSVWREGSHAAWLEPAGPRIISDRRLRGDRPWVTPLPTRNRQPPGPLLPPARVDEPAARSGGQDDPE